MHFKILMQQNMFELQFVKKRFQHKHARETATAIKGLTLEKARDYMLSVIAKERAIPFRRFKNQVGHRVIQE